MVTSVRRRIDASRYDNWEWYFLAVAAAVSVVIAVDLRPVTSWLASLDGVRLGSYTFAQVLVASLQGIVVGMIGGKLYARGSVHLGMMRGTFRRKEWVVLARLGVLTILGIVIGLVIPDLVYAHAEFVVVQMTGFVLLVGYVLVHAEVVNWRLAHELPAVLACVLLAVVPLVT